MEASGGSAGRQSSGTAPGGGSADAARVRRCHPAKTADIGVAFLTHWISPLFPASGVTEYVEYRRRRRRASSSEKSAALTTSPNRIRRESSLRSSFP